MIRQFATMVLISFLLLGYAKSQVLHVGDTVPSFTLNEVMGYEKPALSLSDFDGKYILLDFWSHGCISCVESFPEIDSIQQKFKDRLQVILVNNESKDSTERWLKRRNAVRLPKAPLIMGGGLLSSAFPQKSYPMHVWIDQDRVVRYITHGWNATEENIASFLDGKILDMDDVTFVPMEEKNVMSQKQLYEEITQRALSFSFFAKFEEGGVDPGNHLFVVENGKRRFSLKSGSVEWLLMNAFIPQDELDIFPKDAVVFNTEDTKPYRQPKEKEQMDYFYQHYLYTYDFILPDNGEQAFRQDLQYDLMNRLSLRVYKRALWRTCFVLERIGKQDLLATKGEDPVDSLFSASPFRKRIVEPKLVNMPFKVLDNRLRVRMQKTTGMALLNETGYQGKIDIKLSNEALKADKLELLNSELQCYGLRLKKKKRKINCLVIEKL